MKTSRFTEEQMVAILREGDKVPVPEVARKHKVSEQTIYAWRKRFGVLEPADIKWLAQQRIDTALIDPGKPWQNGDAESFNGKFRDECLSLEWFRSRIEARVVIESWRQHYNHVRPHQSLSDLAPIEFKARYHSIHPGAILQL